MKNKITQQQGVYACGRPTRLRQQLLVAAAGLLVSFGAAATDFSRLSTEELAGMRSRLGEMSEQDQSLFYKEMRTRLNDMSLGERMRLMRSAKSAEPDGTQPPRYGAGTGSPGFGYGYEQRRGHQGSGGGR